MSVKRSWSAELTGATMARRAERSAYVVAIVAAAATVRVMLLVATVEVPGDGPTRAVSAYEWSEDLQLVTHGFWLPGFMYLGGCASFLVPDPLWSSRLLNLALGVSTVLALLLLTHHLYGPPSAAAAASMLALMPLHIELSVSSLSEASFTCEVVTALFLITTARTHRAGALRLTVSLALLSLACLTRYEAWLLIPLFMLYLYQTHGAAVAFAGLVATAVAPLAWMLGNYVAVGDPLYGLSMAVAGGAVQGSESMSISAAAALLLRMAVSELGLPAAVLVVCGLGLGVRAVVCRSQTPERRVYHQVLITYTIILILFASVRGAATYERYVAPLLVLGLPAIGELVNARRYYPWLRSMILLLGVAAIPVWRVYAAPRLVTYDEPHAIKRVVGWLQDQERYRDVKIVLTDMEWQASYFALYWPEVATRRRIVSDWMDDHELDYTMRVWGPTLLVTTDRDQRSLERIERLAHIDVDRLPLVHLVDGVRVYELTSSARPEDFGGETSP